MTYYQHGYAVTLIATQQYRAAAALYEEIYDSTHDLTALHQLGYLAFTSAQPETAKAHFLSEQLKLPEQQALARSLNAYQLGRLALKSGATSSGVSYAELSLETARRSHCILAQAFALSLLGQLKLKLGQSKTAQSHLDSAGRIWQLRSPHSLSSTQEFRLIPLLLEGFPDLKQLPSMPKQVAQASIMGNQVNV